MASRGCPHFCCFCASHSVHTRKMRYHSLNRIESDLLFLKTEYSIRTVIFQDDHFLSNKNRALEIIKILRKLELTAFFPNSLALYALDWKILEALSSIGVKHLVLSVESGSEKVLKDIMHKPLDLSIIKRVIGDCRELNIATDVSILIGLPGETKGDIEDTISFMKSISPTWYRISMATPLVGSEMYSICEEGNYLKGDIIECDFKRPIIETEDFTPEFIQEKAYLLNLELNFVENPDLKLKNYEQALKGFENAIRVKADHAFALYYAAVCSKQLSFDDKAALYEMRYKEVVSSSEYWRNYCCKFGLPIWELEK
ncbi:MAG: radical SAM protein [Syntrophothermus sp.]